jgi:hypothetical protein
MKPIDVSLSTPDIIKSHAGCTVQSKSPLTVQSSPHQWHYAVSVALRDAIAAFQPLVFPARVSASVNVQSGELGCLLVADDFTTLLARVPAPVRAGHHTVDLVLEKDVDVANLVFRNVAADNRPCVFTVESVSISPESGAGLKSSLTLDDLLEGRPPRLDVAKLHEAVTKIR